MSEINGYVYSKNWTEKWGSIQEFVINIFSSRAHLAEPANAIVGWLLERVLKIRICVSALVEEFEKLGKASKEQLEQGKPPDKYWFWQRYFHTRTMH